MPQSKMTRMRDATEIEKTLVYAMSRLLDEWQYRFTGMVLKEENLRLFDSTNRRQAITHLQLD